MMRPRSLLLASALGVSPQEPANLLRQAGGRSRSAVGEPMRQARIEEVVHGATGILVLLHQVERHVSWHVGVFAWLHEEQRRQVLRFPRSKPPLHARVVHVGFVPEVAEMCLHEFIATGFNGVAQAPRRIRNGPQGDNTANFRRQVLCALDSRRRTAMIWHVRLNRSQQRQVTA